MDEREWIIQILAGNVRIFSCLVAKYERMAYTIAFRILENREDAEEVVQDAFVKAYKALAAYKFEGKFSTWLYRIVYRTALNAHKQQSIFTQYEDIGSATLDSSDIESATFLLEQKDRREIIMKVLNQLPLDVSLLLTLYYLEDCSIEDIHQITGLSISNAKVKLFRARKCFYEIIRQFMRTEITDII